MSFERRLCEGDLKRLFVSLLG